jgi:hypothetical protein
MRNKCTIWPVLLSARFVAGEQKSSAIRRTYFASNPEQLRGRKLAMRTVLRLSLIGVALLGLSTMASAADGAKTVLILDSTAQMSANLGQHRKIDAVKTAVAGAVSRMDSQALLGVWAFGTDPAKKCEDMGELVALQAAGKAAGALDRALSPVQPKAGRAAVTGALQAALAAAGEPKDGAISAVIIAGTGDDCAPDVCVEAQKLHSTYPNAKLNVLGLAMSEGSAGTYTCAAKAMGGTFTAVKTATDLDKLLRQTLGIAADAKPMKAASLEAPAQAAQQNQTAAAPEQTQAPGAQAPAATAPAPAPAEVKAAPPPEPNTVLSASLADGTPALDTGVTWELYKYNTTATGQTKLADTASWIGGGGKAQIKLAEGRYQVRAAYGYARAEDTITVGGAKLEKTVILNAGTVSAEGLQKAGGAKADNVFFLLTKRQEPSVELGRSSESPAIFQVNAGEYTLAAVSGPARIEGGVKVLAGQVSVVKMALNTGTLQIAAYEAEGATVPVPALHRIYAAAASAKKAGPLLTVKAAVHRVQLPAGEYRLVSEYGNATVESTISVAAGQALTKNVVLGAGQAMIAVPEGKPARVCAVYEEGANRAAGPAGRAAGTLMSFILKAGAYEVECRSQGAPAPVKPAGFRVVAGQTQEAKLAE